MKKLMLIALGVIMITSVAAIKNEGKKNNETISSEKVKTGLLVILEAKPGKETEVENFLRNGLPIVLNEKQTITWYALRLGKSTFGIFDTFPNEEGRNAHLSGKVAEALMAKAPELFSSAPEIKKVEILTSKLPE